jgi:hypothetical protein
VCYKLGVAKFLGCIRYRAWWAGWTAPSKVAEALPVARCWLQWYDHGDVWLVCVSHPLWGRSTLAVNCLCRGSAGVTKGSSMHDLP